MKNVKKTGKHAALLSIIEVGLGSFLHGLKLPLSGQILSLNQIFILTRASIDIKDPQAGSLIGTTSAILKSLSPAGKKLTPMLAIAAQGHLFSLGTFIGGTNLIGHLIGAILAGLWAFIQPLMIYLLLFGEDLIFMFNYFIKKLSKITSVSEENFYFIFSSLIIAKLFFAIMVVIMAHYIKEEQFEKYHQWSEKFKKHAKRKSNVSPLKGAIKDVLNPLFIISIVCLFTFFFYSNENYSKIIWLLLRPLAGGFILFYLIRVFPIELVVNKLKNGKYKSALEETLRHIK